MHEIVIWRCNARVDLEDRPLAGFFFACLAAVVLWSAHQPLTPSVRSLYRVLGCLWVFDGLYVKFYTFGGTDSLAHSSLAGCIDTAVGLSYLAFSLRSGGGGGGTEDSAKIK